MHKLYVSEFIEILEGASFKDVARSRNVSTPFMRYRFMKTLYVISPALYREGVLAKVHGAYITPSLFWCRENKSRIRAALTTWRRHNPNLVYV